MELAGSMSPDEVGKLREFQRELEGHGYEVREVAFAAGDRPSAVVLSRLRTESSVKAFVDVCRYMLSVAEEIDAEEYVSPEEAEVLSSARTALDTAWDILRVRRMKRIGTMAKMRKLGIEDRGEEER